MQPEKQIASVPADFAIIQSAWIHMRTFILPSETGVQVMWAPVFIWKGVKINEANVYLDCPAAGLPRCRVL